MWKKKLCVQISICMIVAVAYIVIQNTDAPKLQEKSASVVAVMSKHYTVSDVSEKGKQAVMNVIKAPVTVTSYIIASQEEMAYGQPIDTVKKGETGSVYSVAGGTVIETGENEKIGKYIKIKHENAVSIYGNCNKLYAKESEHVRKGQVIASFTNDGTKDFYYKLVSMEEE